MAEIKRTAGFALAALAVALTFLGIVLAATDSNPSGIAKDSLALGGNPPRSASLLMTVSTGQSYTVTATISMNFNTARAQALVSFPLLFSQTSVELRLIGDHVYAEAADISSGKWLEITAHPPAFFGFGLALELTQPGQDLKLVDGFQHKSVTTSGYSTIYNFSSNDVALSNVLASPKKTVLGSLNITVTTGASGEVTGATMTSRSRHDMSKITVQVLSYNKTTKVSAPLASDVSAQKVSSVQQLFSSTSIVSLLLPDNFATLGQGTSTLS
jgi:hypothetical protein